MDDLADSAKAYLSDPRIRLGPEPAIQLVPALMVDIAKDEAEKYGLVGAAVLPMKRFECRATEDSAACVRLVQLLSESSTLEVAVSVASGDVVMSAIIPVAGFAEALRKAQGR